MEVVSSHLELYWTSYGRFTRGISTQRDHTTAGSTTCAQHPFLPAADPARVGQPGLVDPRSAQCGLGSTGWSTRAHELNLGGAARTTQSTYPLQTLFWTILMIFYGLFRLVYEPIRVFKDHINTL